MPRSPSPENQFTTVAAVYDSLMHVVPYPHWINYVERLWERFGASPRTVLEVACGTGNVLQELDSRGYHVAGADYSDSMLAEARQKLGPEIPLFHQDMRALDLGRAFDACLCLFDSLNYLLKEEHLREAFAGVRRHLEPGGTFIFDMNAIRALETGMFDQRGTGADPSLEYDWTSEWDPVSRLCTIEMEYRVQTDRGWQLFRETHVQRGYTLPQIHRALQAADLEILATYDSFTFREPNARSDRYHLVARCPAGAGWTVRPGDTT